MFVRGVTLLEILVVVLIVGIIASLALPSYRQHLVRVHRTEATTGLYEISAAQQRFYLRRGRYASDLYAAAPDGLGLAVNGEARHYGFSIATAEDGQSYIASARPMPGGSQAADGECLVFSLDHRGRRAVSGTRDTPYCWR